MHRRSSIHYPSFARILAIFAVGLSFSVKNTVQTLGQWSDSVGKPSNLGEYRATEGSSRTNAINDGNSNSDAIYWCKSEFTIPFHVDASGKQPAEVQLEISTDNGESWSLYARDSLQSRQFRFTSAQDGVYLFRIKTVDEAGRSFDPGGKPLKVLVDTKSPELTLTIDTDPQGRMVADFKLIDLNPQVDSIRLEYQTEQSNRWTAIPFETNRSDNQDFLGRGKWDIPASVRQLVVRLIARDAAGNESEVTRLPLLPKTAQGNGGLQFASGAPSARFGQNYSPAPSATSGVTAGPQIATKAPTAPAPTPAPAMFGKPFSDPNAIPKPSRPVSLPTPSNSMASSVSRYPMQPLQSDVPKPVAATDSEGVLYLEEKDKPYVPGNAPARNDLNSPAIDTDRVEPPLGTAQSITDKPYFSNSRAFSLDYELDGQAASPVAAIELWGTTDGGRIWERWGSDPDGVSPFDIKVETEGLFGFRMVIIGVNGLAGNRPSNGDNADAWIHVDTEKPTARISTALYGKGTEASSLVIEYNAQDSHFGERPITFSYSELPSGPWTTISNGVRNTGRFIWPADPSLPRRVYLKIEAHDEAGNIGEHRLDIPIDIEGLAPRGRIQGFRPIKG